MSDFMLQLIEVSRPEQMSVMLLDNWVVCDALRQLDGPLGLCMGHSIVSCSGHFTICPRACMQYTYTVHTMCIVWCVLHFFHFHFFCFFSFFSFFFIFFIFCCFFYFSFFRFFASIFLIFFQIIKVFYVLLQCA